MAWPMPLVTFSVRGLHEYPCLIVPVGSRDHCRRHLELDVDAFALSKLLGFKGQQAHLAMSLVGGGASGKQHREEKQQRHPTNMAEETRKRPETLA